MLYFLKSLLSKMHLLIHRQNLAFICLLEMCYSNVIKLFRIFKQKLLLQ